ncbi:MAG: hypothetical protein COU27_02300 [Candidatus Levybacteria bacterium CG10_big_fil_rev_8_21_14_0_10_36_7]|nr:MAG: hypothetical protein COU27_02300 [Candidatus Levybacteria bacterium CG10_big_fil_rev_8_21_14_0_10_36_7]
MLWLVDKKSNVQLPLYFKQENYILAQTRNSQTLRYERPYKYMKEQSENTISISDLGLASLISVWHEPVDFQRINPKRVAILFKKNKKVEQIIQDYWSNKSIPVPIFTLFQKQRLLKDRIYSLQ